MSTTKTTTRRTFLKGGALLAAPLATAVVPAAVMADGKLQRRVSQLEDEAAIRTVHHGWLRQINAGHYDPRLDTCVRRITADHHAAPDRLDLAADHQSAVGYFDYAVEFETPLARDSTLAQMAHAQGHGALRRTERRLLKVNYAKSRGLWVIDTVALSTA